MDERYQGHSALRRSLPATLAERSRFLQSDSDRSIISTGNSRQEKWDGRFLFHHCCFTGRKLLSLPISLLLFHQGIDLPFCKNWVNENWTRRWDGHEHEVLLAQQHSAEDDVAFARSIEPYLRDSRYIRIGGRPLLMLYRPGVLPDAARTVARWRTHFGGAGLGDPYVVMAQAFGDGDPERYGMCQTTSGTHPRIASR